MFSTLGLRSALQQYWERPSCILRQAHLWRFGCDKLAMTTNCRMSEAVGAGRHTESLTWWELHRPQNGCQEREGKQGAKDYGKDANVKESWSKLEDHWGNRYLNYIKVIGFDDNWVILWTTGLERYWKWPVVKQRSCGTVGRPGTAQSNHFCPVLLFPWQMAFPTKAGLTALICCQQHEKKRQSKWQSVGTEAGVSLIRTASSRAWFSIEQGGRED